jgi:hypothetical protein
MRVDDLVNLSDYKPIADRWINRYNEPTQVRGQEQLFRTAIAGAHWF